MEFLRLKPIIEDKSEYDQIEKKIIEWYNKELYFPIFKIINGKFNVRTLKNILNSQGKYLQHYIKSGRIYYSKDGFYGSFNSIISRELIALGAKFDEYSSSYKIKLEELSPEIRSQISFAKVNFNEKIERIDKKLQEIGNEDILSKLNIAKYFDKTLFKVEKEFKKSVENITVSSELTPEERKKVSEDWENNLKLYIKKFTDEQILELRQQVKDNVLAGNRREHLVDLFRSSYNVTENKARFWARQETNLMMAAYKEAKYTDAGVDEYEWRCVHMPHQPTPQAVYKPGEVRYSHGILEGKIFSWKNPPITTAPGLPQRRNNPGQDYQCRCFAIPIVRFKK